MPTTPDAASPVIGTGELYEDAHIKVWDFVLEPGAAVPMHVHRRDHVIVVVEGSELVVEWGDGSTTRHAPRPGETHVCRVGDPVRDVHDARNVGATRYRNLIIEWKRAGA